MCACRCQCTAIDHFGASSRLHRLHYLFPGEPQVNYFEYFSWFRYVYIINFRLIFMFLMYEILWNQVQIGSHAFTFDYVFGSGGIPCARIFDECVAPLIDALFKGYNGTVLAYGQVSSNKIVVPFYCFHSISLLIGIFDCFIVVEL